MIIKGASRRNIAFWSRHLTNDKKNDRVELVEKRGLAADNLRDMMREMMQDASLTRAKNFMYIASFNPQAHEHLTEEQWQQAYEIFEKHRGIPPGQQRIVIEHEKHGRTHRHIVWSRIDLEKMRAFPDGLDLKVCEAAEIEIEQRLGLERTPHLLNREPEMPPPERGPKSWERMRGDRSQIDPRDVTAEITEIFRQSENGADFVNGLRQHGYQFVQGDRAFCILDPAGDVHSLARRIEGVKTKELKAFMQGVDLSGMPSVEHGQALIRERKIERLEAECDTVKQEIEWQEALARAAIEKEKIEERFLAPEDRQRQRPEQEEARAGAHWESTKSDSDKRAAIIAEGQKCQAAEQQRQSPMPTTKPTAPELGRIDAGIRLAYSLTGTGQEFADALEDRGFILARMTEADAERLNKWERQRLKELKELQDALLLKERFRDVGKAITGPVLDEQRQQATRNNPPQFTRADAWMAQTGGVDNLTPELLDQAQANYDQWDGPKEKYDLADYVRYVQDREAERREKQEPGQERPYEKYKAGELVVVDQWSGSHQLNYRNTGDTIKDRETHLQDIALAPLFSVTDAEIVMKDLSAHRQEERRQLWEQKRQEALRPAQERHWPTLPPQPERQSPVLFNQAASEATRDERTENLTGAAAQVWEAWRQTGSDKARAAELAALYGNKSVSLPSPTKDVFAAALDDKGIIFARAAKEEADRSHKQAEFARAAGNYSPRFKEGEIVLVIEARPEWNSEPRRRVYKLDQSLAEKFITRLDLGDKLRSIDATLQASDERQQQRREERTAERIERATDLNDNRAARRASRDVISGIANTGEGILDKGKTAARAIGGALNIGAELSGLLFSAFDTPKPRRQQERDNREGERATDRRNAEAEQQIDFSKYTGDRAQERRNDQGQQAARDRQREIERDR